MESLLMASANLEKDSHSSLTSIERGLLMLKTHLEAFRRRYATDVDVNAHLVPCVSTFMSRRRARFVRQVCVPPAPVADRGDGDQQPPEGPERQTVAAAADRLPAGRTPRQGDHMTN